MAIFAIKGSMRKMTMNGKQIYREARMAGENNNSNSSSTKKQSILGYATFRNGQVIQSDESGPLHENYKLKKRPKLVNGFMKLIFLNMKMTF